MQHGSDAKAGFELVASELNQGRARCIEEQFVECGLVLHDECVERLRQTEDEMQVGDGQKRLTLLAQRLRTLQGLEGGALAVATRMRHEVLATPVRAAKSVRAECRRATQHERTQGAQWCIGIRWPAPVKEDGSII